MNDPTETQSGAPVDLDRRRPGRADYRDPHLISMLRGEPLTEQVTTDENGAEELAQFAPKHDASGCKGSLTAARGTVNALMIGAILWAVIGLLLWHLLGH